MKLVFTPYPHYIHKVLVVAAEAGVLDRLGFIRQVPFAPEGEICEYNPLCKVPAFVLDGGEPLYGGLVICEYLDSLRTSGPSLFPTDASRWRVKRQMMLGDGLFDATTLLRVLSWKDKDKWDREYMARERRKIRTSLDHMERDAAQFEVGAFHIGHVCFAGGLSYLGLQCPVNKVALVAGDEAFDWRVGHPRLEAWYDEVIKRPSMDMNAAHAAMGALNQPPPTENRAARAS
ncbi:MAG: hypothetical protein EXQ85_08550 [Alphaproteobacteria bacterium]|nr:hypothetical protein [Alphaproteobacteria bacterium]